ncbi:MAG: HD domain-containing phosphohydrolase [Bdellovibrionota bacterium]
MLKSKAFDDYFEIPFESLKPGEPLPFNLYLLFQRNRHLLLWKGMHEVISIAFMARYADRGVRKVYLHKDDVELFRIYSASTILPENLPEPAAPVPGPPAEPVVAAIDVPKPQASETPKMPTITGMKIVDILKSPVLTPEQKSQNASAEAKKLFYDLGSAKTLSEQVTANINARDIIRDVLQNVGREAAVVINQVWQMAGVYPELEHAVNVATQGVIFAMAFGRIDEDLIADLAMAGLLHDIGLTQIPPHIASIPLKLQTSEELRIYSKHVRATLEIIDKYTPNVSPRTRAIILQHHEKFNGSGFPQGLKGFHFDDISQLIAIADLLDMISSGHWDGKKHTLADTFDTLEQTEKSRTFPENFNPDVFTILLRWLKDPSSAASVESAIAVVVHQSKNIMEAGTKDQPSQAA